MRERKFAHVLTGHKNCTGRSHRGEADSVFTKESDRSDRIASPATPIEVLRPAARPEASRAELWDRSREPPRSADAHACVRMRKKSDRRFPGEAHVIEWGEQTV